MKLTPTEILEYHFCPRFIYFMNVLQIPQYEERRYIVQRGLAEHEKRRMRNKEYLWKKLGVVKRYSDVFMSSEKYNLQGEVDEIVELKNGSLAPVDYKFADTDKTYISHIIQLYCYCLLAEEAFAVTLNKGYIFYIRGSKRQEEIPFTTSARKEVLKRIQSVLDIIQYEKMPKPTSVKARCADCTYKNICVR